MRVGFDVTPLARPHPRGMVRLVENAVAALEARGRIEVERLEPPPGASVRRWRARDVPRACRELGLAGVHSFTSAFAVRAPGRRVQTIHELPWRHGVRENADWRHRVWALAGPLRADRVVCATEYVARDLRRWRLPGSAPVRVCPWGVGPPFEPEPPGGTIDEVVLTRYRLPEDPLVLCLDGTRPKKNLAALLRGVAEVRRRDGPALHVVVSGPETPQLRRDLGLASQLGLARWVTTLDEIEEPDLPSLLRLATAVSVLARSEGFGFPALEALACGTPALVPREGSQTEVAGEHAVRVDPDDPASVADGLERCVRERETLRDAVCARASELTWDRCAAGLEALWGELA